MLHLILLATCHWQRVKDNMISNGLQFPQDLPRHSLRIINCNFGLIILNFKAGIRKELGIRTVMSDKKENEHGTDISLKAVGELSHGELIFFMTCMILNEFYLRKTQKFSYLRKDLRVSKRAKMY